MKTKLTLVLCAVSALGLTSVCVNASDANDELRKYERAEKFLNTGALTLFGIYEPKSEVIMNNNIQYRWIGDTNKLWYREETDNGFKFILADIGKKSKSAAFDHEKMAISLGKALDQDLNASTLPIEKLIYVSGAKIPNVVVSETEWACNLSRLECTSKPAEEHDDGETVSPDNKYAFFLENYNLWLKNLSTGSVSQLTNDGTADKPYSVVPESNTSEITMRRMGVKKHPVGIFSPDGSMFLTYQLDQTDVKPLHLVQSVPEDGSMRQIKQ